MSDYGERIADKAIAATEKKIRKLYEQAAKELKQKMVSFNQKFKEEQGTMLKRLEAGEITNTEYGEWLRRKVFVGRQWAQKADQATRIMHEANKEAALLVRQGKLNVFAENYNYTAYELERKTHGAVNFNLYDEDSVARLIREKPKMLPEWKIDEKKDYKWNRQKVENSITQGIIQGKGIDEITSDLVQNLCTANNSKMRMFARTGMTGAQNAGRQAQMEDAEDMGIKLKKKWLATLDNRTRDTHQELDGQEVPVDEPFEVDGMEIMFPGDPNAEPELVCNCRCTMIEVYEGIDRKTTRRAYYDEDDEEYEEGKRKSYTVEDMTYKEWKAAKENGTIEKQEKQTETEKPKEDPAVKKQEDQQEEKQEQEEQERKQELDAFLKELDEKDNLYEDFDKKEEEEREKRHERYERTKKIEQQETVVDSKDDAVMEGYKKLETPENIMQTAKNTNPLYKEDKDHQTNCSCCVVANEARARGYDVTAGVATDDLRTFTFNGNGKLISGEGSWTDCFKGIKMDSIKATKKTQVAPKITKLMQRYGDGSRAVVYVQWERGGGHYFTVSNVGGEIVFTNPQYRPSPAIRFFDDCVPSATKVFRIDNCRFTKNVTKAVVGK